MKRLLLYLLTIAGIAAIAAGCGKSDDVDPANPNASVPDPEGTISLSMRNANSGRTYLGSIYIDNADNFTGGYFVSLGKVNGLGNVTRIPSEGWNGTVAVIPGEGYVAYSGNAFYRIYVTNYTTNTLNEVIGAEIKYQTPFTGGDIVPSKSSVTFDGEGGSETLTFGSVVPVSAKVVCDDGSAAASDACRVEITHAGGYTFLTNGVTITAGRNTTMTDRKYKVVITSAGGKECEIDVTVKGGPYIEASINGQQAVSWPANGGTATLTVATNIASEDIRIESDSWMEVSQSAESATTFTVAYQENTTGQERQGKITVCSDKYKDISAELAVSQTPHTFELTSDMVYFDRLQQNESVTITTTASEFTAASDDESWCTLSRNQYVITVRATANDTAKDRTAHIVVKLSDGQTRSIPVYQSRYTAGDTYDIDGVTGTVFDIYYDDGFHGKIMSSDHAQKAWSTETVETGATDPDDGRKNMEIIKAIPNWQTLYPAFAWCTEHGDGWYLPSINELKPIFNLIEYSFSYWSSTERDRTSSYSSYRGSSSVHSSEKTNPYTAVIAAYAF